MKPPGPGCLAVFVVVRASYCCVYCGGGAQEVTDMMSDVSKDVFPVTSCKVSVTTVVVQPRVRYTGPEGLHSEVYLERSRQMRTSLLDFQFTKAVRLVYLKCA